MEELALGPWKATVVDNEDPQQLGRLKVSIPEISGDGVFPAWCLPQNGLLGGGKLDGIPYGSLVVPPPGSTVFVEFPDGDATDNPGPIWKPGWFGDGELPDVLKTNYPHRRGLVTPSGSYCCSTTSPARRFVELKHGKKGQRLTFDKDGKAVLQADEVDIGEGATEKIPSANALVNWLSSHTHGSGVGPRARRSRPPNSSSPPWPGASCPITTRSKLARRG